jgi:hypothetical protein
LTRRGRRCILAADAKPPHDEATAAEISSAVIHSYFAEFRAFQTRLTRLKEQSV